jgi:hypothetical protein
VMSSVARRPYASLRQASVRFTSEAASIGHGRVGCSAHDATCKRQRLAFACIDRRVEGLEILAHHAVQRRLLGTTAVVDEARLLLHARPLRTSRATRDFPRERPSNPCPGDP